MVSSAVTIAVNGLSFSYDRTPVLQSVKWMVRPGERWAVIGANGAGKSTLVRCIGGLERVASGCILIGDTDIRHCTPRHLASLIAYVPQIRGGGLPYSVSEYVMMGRFPYQGFLALPSREDRRIVHEALELTDCVELSDRRMDSLSGGELQRVSIAAAVAQRTQIMLLDEPATFLDPLHQVLVQQSLDRIHDEFGTTLITVTHDLNAALLHYDNVLALLHGEVAYAGAVSRIADSSLTVLRTIYGIPFEWGSSGDGMRKVVMPGIPHSLEKD